MPKQLTAQTATITTAAVEVKTLTVSGKQVTLAVFRQLIEEPILDQLTAEITARPWGTVNYHPDKCSDDPEHVHVVWQRGDELRRSAVQAPGAGRHSHPAADLYVQARILQRTVHGPWATPKPGDTLFLGEHSALRVWSHFADGRFMHDRMSFRGSIPGRLRTAWREEQAPHSEDRKRFNEDAYCLGISDAAARATVAEELLSMLPTAQYRESWAELCALPQLFIAV